MKKVCAMEITLNGKLREVPVATTVTRLLEELKLHQLRVVVQVNLDIIKRDRYETVELKPGDKVEVLTFMAGG
jgi:sulfur carrier protein